MRMARYPRHGSRGMSLSGEGASPAIRRFVQQSRVEAAAYHPIKHAKSVAELTKEISRSKDTFVTHYHSSYSDPALPPVWMVAEVMSFGALSKWIDNLRHRPDRQAIAQPFALDERVFTSFSQHLSIIPNIAAHHGRLWNKRFAFTMILPRNPPQLSAAMLGANQRSCTTPS